MLTATICARASIAPSRHCPVMLGKNAHIVRDGRGSQQSMIGTKVGFVVPRSGHEPTGCAKPARGRPGVGHMTIPPGPPLAGDKPGRSWHAWRPHETTGPQDVIPQSLGPVKTEKTASQPKAATSSTQDEEEKIGQEGAMTMYVAMYGMDIAEDRGHGVCP